VLDLVPEVVGEGLGAMIHAQGQATGHLRGDRAVEAREPLSEGFQCREPVALLRHRDAQALAVPMLDRGEDPYPAVVEGEGAGAVGAPEDMGGVGGDDSLVDVGWSRVVAVRGEQAVLAHEAQHPFASDSDPIFGSAGAPRPCDGLRRSTGSARGRREWRPGVPRPRSWAWGRVDRGAARVAVPAAGGDRSWSGARPRRHTPASRRSVGR